MACDIGRLALALRDANPIVDILNGKRGLSPAATARFFRPNAG